MNHHTVTYLWPMTILIPPVSTLFHDLSLNNISVDPSNSPLAPPVQPAHLLTLSRLSLSCLSKSLSLSRLSPQNILLLLRVQAICPKTDEYLRIQFSANCLELMSWQTRSQRKEEAIFEVRAFLNEKDFCLEAESWEEDSSWSCQAFWPPSNTVLGRSGAHGLYRSGGRGKMGLKSPVWRRGGGPVVPNSASRHPSDANQNSNALDQLIKSCSSCQCNAKVHQRANYFWCLTTKVLRIVQIFFCTDWGLKSRFSFA